MTEVTLYISCSTDGFIAKADGNTDFLAVADSTTLDYGYADFLTSVDTLVMGRKTFDQIVKKEAWPYANKKTYVFTHLHLKSTIDNVVFVSGEPDKIFKKIKKEGAQKIWIVGGSKLIDSVMQYNLIDEFIINLVPALLGDGLPLFTPPFPPALLYLKDAKRYSNSVMTLYYERLSTTPKAKH